MKTTTVTLPEIFASYLINNDASGLSEQEILDIDSFIQENNLSRCLGVVTEIDSVITFSNDIYGYQIANTFEFIFENNS